MADCYLIHIGIDDSSFDGKFFRRVFNILASMDDDELKLLNYKRAIDFVNRLKIDKEDKNNTINLLKLLNNRISTESYLSHHGILGQKWGVRRYQNKDGSYTEAGKKKRLIESQKESYFNKASSFKVKTKTGEVLDIEPVKEWSILKEFGMNLIGRGSKDTMGRRGDANYSINKNGEKIGELSLVNKNHNTAYGDWITIDEDYRGKGYARDILEDVISKARDAGYSRFEINALKKPRPLYERIGFKYADDLSLFDKIAGFEVGAKRMVYNLKDASHFDKTDHLSHWGIKGMKWGVRRYQNEDGTYTAEGKKRRKSESYHDDYKRAHSKKSVSQMSDKELRDRNNRLLAEKQYADLTKSNKYKKGKKIVNELVWAAGAVGTLGAFYMKNKERVDAAASKVFDKVGDYVIKDIHFD